MKILRKFLFPFSILYGIAVFFRNKFFDWNWIQSKSFRFPVICVGNLSTGGTGKSPMIEYLAGFLQEDYRIGVISRGYKRKTKGFLKVQSFHSAAEAGDEPVQFKQKFPEITVAVSESRQVGIKKVKDETEVILLDDAFQHRYVRPSFSILLTAFDNLYSADCLLPAGNLRESKAGAKRADSIVVTKCPPDLSREEMEVIRRKINPAENQHLFFTAIRYNSEIFNKTTSEKLDFLKGKNFTLVTGIANPAPLVDFLEEKKFKFKHIAFPDHHNFSDTEIDDLEKEELILTTEKDYMRLHREIKNPSVFYLPITVSFLNNQDQEFKDLILSHIRD